MMHRGNSWNTKLGLTKCGIIYIYIYAYIYSNFLSHKHYIILQFLYIHIYNLYIAYQKCFLFTVISPRFLLVLKILLQHSVINHFISHLCHQSLAKLRSCTDNREYTIFIKVYTRVHCSIWLSMLQFIISNYSIRQN